MGFKVILLGVCLGLGLVTNARADDSSSPSPYIDKLKSQMKDSADPVRNDSQPQPYIDYLKKDPANANLKQSDSGSVQPHIDQLKQADPSLNAKDPNATPYLDQKQNELGPDGTQSAIDAVNKGNSQLHMKRNGTVKGSIGFKVGSIFDRSYGGNAPYVANPYTTIYQSDTKWIPDLTLFAEYKLFSSEILGSFGIVGSAGFSYIKGFGRFAFQLEDNQGPTSTITQFPLSSRTVTTFITIPGAIQAKYQFNLLKWLKPYALIGPTIIGMSENRNDGIGAQHALSKGISSSIGGAILLDWISDDNAWQLYQDFSVKHVYLTVDYTRIDTISSNVSVTNSGIYAGVLFEF